jgi:hypothetical protein
MLLLGMDIIEKKERKKPSFNRFKKAIWFKEFDHKVKSGVSPTLIARWIQRDNGDFSDFSHKNLIEKIKQYRRHLPPGSFKISRATIIEKMTDKFERDLVELDELKNLYFIQAERIGLLYKREKEYKMPIPQNKSEIALAASLLLKINRLKHESGYFGDIENTQTTQSVIPTDEDTKLGMIAQTLRKALEDMDKPVTIEAKVVDIPMEKVNSKPFSEEKFEFKEENLPVLLENPVLRGSVEEKLNKYIEIKKNKSLYDEKTVENIKNAEETLKLLNKKWKL